MKPLDPALASHILQPVTTLATAYRLQRRDGVTLGFTSFDKDVVIDGMTYASTNGFNPSSIEHTTDFRANTLDIQGALSHPSITEGDLLNGLYDGARVDIFLFNHAQPPSTLTPATVLWLLSAFISEVRVSDNSFIAEVRSLTDSLAKATGDVYSPTCRAMRLGDGRCKVNLTSYTHTYTVASVVDTRTFTHSSSPQAESYFTYGIVRFLNGANQGREGVVKSYANGVIELIDPMPFTVAVGDSIRCIRGCDRRFATCRDVFNNVTNFRGEPPHLLPGTDRVLKPV
jgi:uncharacterized phage protein (TIGR02218 family)